MRNLAGVVDCDRYIEAELTRCGIELVRGMRVAHEVPFSITGRLGEFTMWRAWYYWVVKGPFPLDVATKLYETNEVWRTDVRAAGHCACPHPLEWASHFDAAGREILDRKNEAEARKHAAGDSKTMKLIGEKILAEHSFADDPKVAAVRSIVDQFHVDSELGLYLLAEAVRGLSRGPT